MSVSNPSILPFTPRIVPVTPIHNDGGAISETLYLVFIDIPTSETGTFSAPTLPDTGNVFNITYSGTFPDPNDGNVDTNSIMFYFMMDGGVNTPEVKCTDAASTIIIGTANPTKKVPRDGGSASSSAAASPAAHTYQAFECHPVVAQSATNATQFYSGALIHVPAGMSITAQCPPTDGSVNQLFANPTTDGTKLNDYIAALFASNAELISVYGAGPLYTKTCITSFNNPPAPGIFIDQSTGVDLYTNNADLIVF